MFYDSNRTTSLENNPKMSSYTPYTPPSSNEDSPPLYFMNSPSSTSYQGPETFDQVMEYAPIDINPHIYMDPPDIDIQRSRQPVLELLEQPTDRFRFRYKSEMAGTHGSLTGMNSDRSRKQTFPTVELRNFTGQAVVRCSIYQINAKDKEHMPHAHRLIMKNGKEEQDDPHDMTIGPEHNFRARFNGMGIIHTAKKNIVGELIKKKTQLKKEDIARREGKQRELNAQEAANIKGLAEAESKSINLNIVCLRFDAFKEQGGILFPLCEPIFSHGINNLKSALTGDLKIVRLDRVVCEAKGNKEIFLLVERVTKKNIKIRFYELDDQEQVVWEGWGQFNDLDVHHQYAIVCKTPKYRDQNITEPVDVFIELVRPTDEARSEPRQFRYIPNRDVKPGMKRRKYDYSLSFSSSDFSSNELPATIGNIKSEQGKDQIQANTLSYDYFIPYPENLSEEIKKALKDIDCTEFQNLLKEHGPEFSKFLDTDDPKSLDFDGPKNLSNRYAHAQYYTKGYVTDAANQLIKLEVNQRDRHKAAKFMEELKSFIKVNKNNVERAQKFLTTHLGEDKVTNALHVLISLNKVLDVDIILKILQYFQKLDLVNIRNDSEQTPLQLAIMCHNFKLVIGLLRFSAMVNTTDSDLNTALHYAIKVDGVSTDILECLLKDRPIESVITYVDSKNKDGITPLCLAIEKGNLPAVKLLYSRGANINDVHPKNGFVPLRLAIENHHTHIVKYLLTLPNVSYSNEDFNGVAPLAAAMQKELPAEMKNLIVEFMNEKGIRYEIKQEETDSDDDTEEEFGIKPEPMDVEELEALYDKVKIFTPKYLEEISQILDTSNVWGSLAELLGFEHLISSGLIKDKSMSKAVLKYATETINASLWEIRIFLESLDETRAVQVIDRMVQDLRN